MTTNMADGAGVCGKHRVSIMLSSLCLTVLAACSDKAPPAAPPAAAAVPATERLDDVLMTAVFGKDYRAGSREAVAELAESQETKAAYRVQPVQHTVLATGDTVLLARAILAGADATANHGQTGWLSVYYLRQEQGRWRVLARHDSVMQLDRNADFKASWVKPGKGKEGMAVLFWHKGKKECQEENLALFDFASSGVLPVSSQEIPVRSVATDECTWTYPDSRWSIASTWELVPTKGGGPYHDLKLTFSGEIIRPPRDDAGQLIGPPVKTPVSGHARYKFRDGETEFGVVEGENPIPQDSDQYG